MRSICTPARETSVHPFRPLSGHVPSSGGPLPSVIGKTVFPPSNMRLPPPGQWSLGRFGATPGSHQQRMRSARVFRHRQLLSIEPGARRLGIDRPMIEVDPGLVEQLLLELARHGAYGETGVWRTAYSAEWVAAQDEVAALLADAG